VPDLSNYPVSVENCGRTLTFAAPPKRVIGMWQPSNELLLALGVQDQMIGFAGMYDKLPAVFADAVRRVPKLGSIFTLNLPNKEEMIQAHPDLVVTEGLDSFAFDAAQGYATVQQVQAMGTQIYSSGSICDFKVASTRGLASVYQDLKALGQILGVSKRADEIVRRLQARENAVRQTVAPLKPVRVAFFNGDSEKIYVLNGAIWSDLMAKAGGINVFEDKKTNGVMSPEVFAGIDADVILYGIFPVNSVMPGRDPDKIKAYLTQTFPNIPAVKNGRLYPIQTINTESSVRAMDGLELIAKALHPEAFK
jgi:iron complex transport system substrate-binding protein